MNINLADNLFISHMNFIDIDSLSISYAKELFLEYQEAGVIKESSSFDDRVWLTTNEYSNVGLYFDFDRFFYNKYAPVFGLSFDEFTDYVKTYAISIFSKNVLISIENTLLDIKHLLEQNYEDVCKGWAELKLYSANRLSDFLTLLITDENEEEMDKLLLALDNFMSISSTSGKDFNQRELADHASYLDFNEIIEDYWNSDISKEDRLFYYPLYIWWVLTAVVPLRPREFLLIERNCLTGKAETGYKLKLRRNLLKGGQNGKLSHKIIDSYLSVPQSVPNHIGELIANYIKETEKYDNTELDTLFVTDPHYKKWQHKKHNDSRFLTYSNMRTILKYFYKEVIQDKYGYTIRYDHENIDHNNKEIEFIHLGDTRHIAFTNLSEEGISLVSIMLIAGHADVEMTSHYCSNTISLLECRTYKQHQKLLGGDKQFKLSHTKKLPPAASPVALPDGSLCYSENYKKCNEEDCIKAVGPKGEIGYCRECIFYRGKDMSYFSGDDLCKHRIEEDCQLLFLATQAVMEGKGNPENIHEAIKRLNSSKYSYKAYLEQKLAHEMEDS